MTRSAIGYARLNHDDGPFSALRIDPQSVAIRNYAEARRFKFIECFFDEGCSTDAVDLPGLEDALAAVAENKCDAFIIFDLSRHGVHSRSIRTLQLLAQSNTTLHTVLEGRIRGLGRSTLHATALGPAGVREGSELWT